MRSASTAPALLSLLSLLGPVLGHQQAKTVTTLHGKVEGYLSSYGDYYEFMGIRYGVPIKFRAPAEPPTFSGVFKADIRHVACAQPKSTTPFSIPSENEDCLVLNVFTPAGFNSTSTLPVMVYIHGGDFTYGSSTPSFYGPRFLVAQDIIVVSINYRLNAYGFLNLGIPEAPGNAGLKDQRAALRWVRNNIANFGGNPENVTVFGQGAGATSAIYLTLSPTTKGLFQGIIVDSGTIFTKNSYDPNPTQTAEMVAKSLGRNPKSEKDLFEIFSTVPVPKVLEAVLKVNTTFCPSLEEIFEGEEPFLIDTPYNILATGLSHPAFNPVPVIIGHTTSEVLVNMIEGDRFQERVESIKKGDLSSFLPRSLKMPSAKDASELLTLLKATYLANKTDTDSAVAAVINFDTDFTYTGPMSLFSDIYSNSSKLPVYDYIFEHIGERNVGRKMLSLNNTIAGTTHYDELFYVLDLESQQLPMDEADSAVAGTMITLWTNFAKYNQPSPPGTEAQWMPHPHRLSLKAEPAYVQAPTPDRAAFWRSIYFKYGADIRRA